LTAVPKKLTKVTGLSPGRHRLWAELRGDSPIESLRFGTLGWVPRKAERVVGVQDKFAVCVLCAGTAGTFRDEASGETRRVRGPGVWFVRPGGVQDYGPDSEKDCWEEFYWIVEGERASEWLKAGWWDRQARFWPVAAEVAAEAWEVFCAGCEALDRREVRALDRAKLALERWLSEGVWAAARGEAAATAESPVARVVEEWRRDLARDWSLRDCARKAGMSYTRFRARFVQEQGRAPHAHLTRLRLELARRWLRSTEEPVKAVALRCGFSRVEPFIRAFAKEHGRTPGRWREEQAERARGR
jgi:AraC-like DNA-binding protein